MCAQELSKDFPLDSLVQSFAIPSARAAAALGNGNPALAIDVLRAATPYEFGPFVFGQGYLPGYLRGQAYLDLKKGPEAVIEFQRFSTIMARRRLRHSKRWHTWARRAAGHSAATGGEATRLLALWKTADAGIPILRDAKAEYVRLE